MRSTPHKNVRVYLYAEINHVNRTRMNGVKRMVNCVLPHIDVDFVSVSAYEIMNYMNWPKPRTEESLRKKLYDNLDYVQSNFKPREGIPGKRVFIGEIGYRVSSIVKNEGREPEAAEREQSRLALMNAKLSLEWGVPFWLWWSFHDTDVEKKGDPNDFGLMSQATGKKRKLYDHMKAYCSWARQWEENNPGLAHEVFRRSAVSWLGERLENLERH